MNSRTQTWNGGLRADVDGVAFGRHSYRQRLASLIPAALLAYILILLPLFFSPSAPEVPGVVDEDIFANRVFFPLLAATSLALLLAEWRRIRWRRSLPVLSIFALSLLAGMSSLWSLAPDITFSKFMLLALAVAAPGVAVLISGSIERCLAPMFWVMAAAVAINLLAIATSPAGPIGHDGIYVHKNILGRYMAISLVLGLAGMLSRSSACKATGFAMVLGAILSIAASLSKTSLLLALLVPLLAAAMMCVRRWLAVSLTMQTILIVVCASLYFQLANWGDGPGIGAISTLIAGEPTFTGRVPLWSFMLEQIADRPMLGHGYRAFWGIGPDSPATNNWDFFISNAGHGHNGYLDTLLELGIAGLAILTVMILSALALVDRIARHNVRLAFLALCLVLLPVLNNLLESIWLNPMDATTIPFTLLLFASGLATCPVEKRYVW